MPPIPATTLPELIHQLGSTYSPFERLKILTRAWTVLRQLPPEQRLVVAGQLGLDHAEEVVEAIARRSGHEASPALVAMIEQAQVKGTVHLPELIADLRDPQRRIQALKQGARATEGVLAGEPAAPWLPAGTLAPAKPAAPPVPAPVAPRVVAPEPVAVPTPAPIPAPAPVAAPPAPPAPAPVPVPPVLETPAPAPKPPAPPARPPGTAGTTGTAGEEDTLAGRLGGAASLTARFQILRRHLEEARGLSAEELLPAVEAFPDGWARRRALLELLRSGSPGALPDALGLVESLGAERDRAWCLGALADGRALAGHDRESLLAAVSSLSSRYNPLRRRLE